MVDKRESKEIVVQFAEPIFGYCMKRLQSIQDAQDLSQEILMESFRCLSKNRDIQDISAYIWKIAHNCYAKKFMNEKATYISLQDSGLDMVVPDFSDFDRLENEQVKQAVFKAVVGIAKSHRDILVDYYVKELAYSEIAEKRSILVNTVKSRLFYGKQKLRERFDKVMKENSRVYDRINWFLMCNGYMDANKYLDKQICRAICKAAYDKPVSIEEISENTGIPCLYIEDELESLLYGEAMEKIGEKYQTTFIIHTKELMEETLEVLNSKIDEVGSKFLETLRLFEDNIRTIPFYGNDFQMEHLLWLLLPLTVRNAISQARQKDPQIRFGGFLPRRDGGNGYFVVLENENEHIETNSGCNSYFIGENWDKKYSYYWWGKHFDNRINIFLDRAINISFNRGVFDFSAITDEELALLIKHNFITRSGESQYSWNIPVFTYEQYMYLEGVLNEIASGIVPIIADVVKQVYLIYQKHVPKHVHSQINGIMGGELNRMIGLIITKFINNEYLKEPHEEYFTKQILLIYNREL